MVRGFWGDILNSPYVPFGVEIESEEDKEKFFKKVNFQRIYVSISHIKPYSLNELQRNLHIFQ